MTDPNNHDKTSTRRLNPQPPDVYARARHVRYFERGVVYHFVSRTRGNLFLLRPDLEGHLRRIFVGVLAKAKDNFGGVANFGTAAMSNHLHMLLAPTSDDPRMIVDYVGFVKREVARRWRQEVNWPGSIFEKYECAAVLTPEAQIRTLKYVIGQGCAENLVADPRDWPGFNCAQSLVTGEPMHGEWLDGTAYGKELHREKVKKNPKEVSRQKHTHPRSFSFDPLPALAHLSDEAYQREMRILVEELVAEREQQYDFEPLGPEAVCTASSRESRTVPKPPWFEERRRFIVWDNEEAPRVHEYLDRYWDHQEQYRAAVRAWLDGEVEAQARFPDYSFVPGLRLPPNAQREVRSG